LKALKLKFKTHQAMAHNNKLKGFKVQVQNPPSSGPQQQASGI
jgi:hypothetical protein